ncbi:MAG TPA: DUF3568 family protein [Candidatus Omnitrophica bacterium]|nr:MAG: hypothetical protein DRP69_00415 [Candidatus Omnitrophota bacterium]RKY42184.1 MAG: hypothetical protein DRP80_07070 [Candidatus Omnitrophota bacterium]HEC69303.1 DUF3568 family protein [Candidatus Omnitrophota bacterium]
MRKNLFLLSVCFWMLSLSSIGCVPVLIGTGVVTGYLATKDSASGNIETSFDKLWEVSLRVVSKRAEITDRDKDLGLIKAKKGKDQITVKIKELTEHSYNLKVTCRKALALANLKLAQDIFTKIVRNLGNR